jgi:predicted transcriptional regulator
MAAKRGVSLNPERLRELRRDSCRTRRWVARGIGAPPAQVKRYERGEAMCPAAHRNALAELFGVSVPYLMGWKIGGDA